MKVAILYSGGKDSNYALESAIEKGWEIKYLLSIKPNRTDCYLFHYATVEHTPIQAKLLNIPHILVPCSVADPILEANIVKEVVKKNPVDAVILGGTGLQVTQIKSVQDALLPLGIETFPSHAEYDHNDLLKEMVNKGYKIMITQIASQGLDKEWLGKVLTKDNIEEFFTRSKKYGFPLGGDGGYYDTFVLECPLFNKKINILKSHKHLEAHNIGHVIFDKMSLTEHQSTKISQKDKDL